MCVMCVMTEARGRARLSARSPLARQAKRSGSRRMARTRPSPTCLQLQLRRWAARKQDQPTASPQHPPAPCPRPGNRYSIGRRSFVLAADRPAARTRRQRWSRPRSNGRPQRAIRSMYARQTRRRELRRSARICRTPGSVVTSRRLRFKRNARLPGARPRIAPRCGSLRPARRPVPLLSRLARGLERIAHDEQEGRGV